MMDHLLETDLQRFPVPFSTMSELKNRSVLVQRTRRIDFECVVRGYLAGSAWKEYQSTGSLPGIQLPAGLRQSDQLPQPLFTPATKAEVGDHDENVSFERMKQDLGDDLAEKLKQVSIDIFLYASGKMAEAGILLCDTKFEFGLLDGKLVLIDEVLTPDSSRYWDASTWAPGTNPPGYDKQYVRDYVEELGWNKSPPAPHLPDSVIEKTIGLYQSIEKRIEQVLR
jgi:phosphoribosylaminoimidazole-succinocarboxamide synthase